MKVTSLLPLVAVASAIVVPDEHMVEQLALQTKQGVQEAWEQVPSAANIVNSVKNSLNDAVESVENAFDTAIDFATKESDKIYNSFEDAYSAADVEAWLRSSTTDFWAGEDHPHPPPHDGPPGHGKPPPHKRPPPHGKPPHHGPPGHHNPHKHSNKTIWELVSSSKYSTKFAAYLKNDTELVKALNGSSHNFTVFVPIDKAVPDAPKHTPPQGLINKILSYHVLPWFYPVRRILGTHTVPTLLNGTALGGPQRLKFNLGLGGLRVNYFARVVGANLFATNGVIHAIDHVLLPPPSITTILSFLPGDFSTLTLGLTKTGLLDSLNTTTHVGATVFAPDNWAFKKLGPKINAFLFSKFGEKYLKALLEYHVVLNHTLYSNAYYDSSKSESAVQEWGLGTEATAPKFHYDLPTLLENRYLAIDVASWGPFIEIKVNAFSRVKVQDGIARDGVLQIVGDVLIPPKTKGAAVEMWKGEELSVEELKERLEPFVEGERPEL